MLNLILVTDDLVRFEITAGLRLRQMIFDAIKIFVEKLDSSIEINGSIVSVGCPNQQTTKTIEEIVLQSRNYFSLD